jgi:hypothetical protein
VRREVAVDPDVRAHGDLLAVEQPVTDDEHLLVLRPRRVDELVAALRARLPVGGDERAAAGVGVRLDPLGEERDRLLRSAQ